MPSLNIRSLPFVVFMGGFPSRLQNLSSGAIRPGGLLFNLLNLEKLPLEWFNQIHLLAVHQHPHWEASWQNREKVIKQFLRKLPPNGKWAKFDLSDLYNWPLGWFNQIHIFTVHWYLPNKAPCQRRKKVIKQFLRNKYFKWRVDDGRRRRTDDDGRTTTDESALEKLRCLPAGGAKNSNSWIRLGAEIHVIFCTDIACKLIK